MDELTIVTPVGCIGNRGVATKALAQTMEKYLPNALATDGMCLPPRPDPARE